MIENFLYILSISFQLAAAWLLIENTSVKRKGIIKAYCAEHKGGIPFDSKGKLVDRSGLEITVRTAWVNKIAFYFLGIGYLINVFGVCPEKKEYAAMAILVITSILVIGPTDYVKKKAHRFESPDLDEIPLVDGVHIDIVGDEEYQKSEIIQ